MSSPQLTSHPSYCPPVSSNSGWHRRTHGTPADLERKKQYNSREHKQRRKQGQRQVDAGQAHCWRCGRHIAPGMPWHLGHDDHDRTIYHGVECVSCNVKAAARKGNAVQRGRQARTRATRRW